MSATKPMLTTAGAVAFDVPPDVPPAEADEREELDEPAAADELDELPDELLELELQAASTNTTLAAMATRPRLRDTQTPCFQWGSFNGGRTRR
jgi:hypothetical protein